MQQLTLYSVYPLYHTVYETFYMVKNLVDPEFIYHRAVGQYYGFLLLSMSNSRILPLNCRDYATDLEYHFHNLNYTHGEAFAKRGIDLSKYNSPPNLNTCVYISYMYSRQEALKGQVRTTTVATATYGGKS